MNRNERDINSQSKTTLKDIDEDIKNLDEKVKEIKLEIAKEEARSKELVEEINLFEKELENKQEDNHKLQKETKQYLKRVHAIKNSTIWNASNLVRKKLFKINSSKKTSENNNKKTNNKNAERKIRKIKTKLLNLGFNQQAKLELEELANSKNGVIQSLASRELALWHANKRNEQGALKSLHYINKWLRYEKDITRIVQATVLAAESYMTLGKVEEAKNLISREISRHKNADLYITAANLEEDQHKRIEWINKLYEMYDVAPIKLSHSSDKFPYDTISYDQSQLTYFEPSSNTPKVTVIIPVFNAEDVVQTAIESVLNQTWRNLEVIVVDDCSTDNTYRVIEEYIEKDNRVKLIQTETNGGAYMARNLAITHATGDFITLNDSDDWSHPQKIEKQVVHLLNNPEKVGNTSQQVRATSNLFYFRRGNFRLMFTNMSSFMFRREVVLDKVGFYDCVRFGADAEYLRRVKKTFGKDAIVDLRTGPLSFQRQSDSSLTGNSAFGFHGYFMGARKEYVESQSHYHSRAESLKYDFPQQKRVFPVPEPMWPKREQKDKQGRRSFDLVIVSDYRTFDNEMWEYINNHVELQNKKVGFVQMYQYEVDPLQKIKSEFRDLIDGEQFQMIVYGEKIKCNNLVIYNPNILKEWQRFIPKIDADNVSVIANNITTEDEQNVIENIQTYYEHLLEYFGEEAIWYTDSNVLREAMENISYIKTV
ncbi:glycosyltransferase family 2 protein [Gracilibacillus suaedae]|uniref:glycosyltransferase family 2 protein n=1 Tax=Gracilibacillus suaedae TaxID=2820273 RepID=UPI001ABDD881|nr:glycosyltransferase family A protein [Gracilibacillus suaedae]